MRPGFMAATTHGPDRRTSLADIRALSCILAGVPLKDIHPASGHELTEHAYRNSRESWADHIAAHGLTHDYARAGHEEARRYWETHRPAYLTANPWPTA